MPQNLAFYFYASVWWGWTAESNPAEKQVASRSLMKLKAHFKQKLEEYYQVRAFYALQDNYEILKGFKDQRSKKLARKALRSLKRYTAIQAVRNHKVAIMNERRSTRMQYKALVALRMFSRKMRELSQKRQQIESKRKSICKFKVLHAWNKRQL